MAQTKTSTLLVALAGLGACGTGAAERIDERRRQLFSERPIRTPIVAEVPIEGRARSQSQDPPRDLEAYLLLGMRHSSRLAAGFERYAARVELAEVAGSLPDPRLSWAEWLEELETRTGPQRRRFGVSQVVPFPGVRSAREDLAEAEAQRAWAELEHERLELFGEIERAHADYAYLGARLELVERQVGLLESLEAVVQGRIQGGGDQSDLLQLQVELGRLANERDSVRAELTSASARLEAAIEWAGPRPLPVPAQRVQPALQLDREVLLERALAGAPAVAVARAAAAHSARGVDLVRSERWPDLELGLELADTGDALDPTTPGSGDDPLALRLSFGVPVWVARDAARVRAARHEERASLHSLETRLVELERGIETLAFELEDAQRQVRLHREQLLPRASDARDLVIAEYRGGGATLLDVIDAERVELGLQDALARSVRDAARARTRLESLIGGEL